jgi:DNA-binding transcriptional ArsR family regulator
MRVAHLDATTIKVLAHPLRMRLIGTLRLDGPSTASGLAQRLGVSSGLTSYHLRALAEAGFVEDDPDHPAKGRERWWRSAHDMTSWRAGSAGDDPDAVAAEAWLAGWAARRSMAWIDGWLARRTDAPAEWQAVSGTSDYVITATPAEVQSLTDQITELLRPYLAITGARGDVEGGEEVRVLVQTFLRGDDE